MTFKTHNGETISGDRLKQALADVANDWRALAYAIREKDLYASHVTTEQKEQALKKDLQLADEVERGEINSFTMWQRVNEKLTGECVALFSNLPKIN